MTTDASPHLSRSPGRGLAWFGIALAMLAIAVYVAQLAAHRLVAPWYLPIATTIGLVLIGAAVWQRRGMWRGMALVVVLLLAGAEWMFLFATRLPDYTGPVAVGKTIPDFETTQADGKPFTADDLRGTQSTVLVFFRGRW